MSKEPEKLLPFIITNIIIQIMLLTAMTMLTTPETAEQDLINNMNAKIGDTRLDTDQTSYTPQKGDASFFDYILSNFNVLTIIGKVFGFITMGYAILGTTVLTNMQGQVGTWMLLSAFIGFSAWIWQIIVWIKLIRFILPERV